MKRIVFIFIAMFMVSEHLYSQSENNGLTLDGVKGVGGIVESWEYKRLLVNFKVMDINNSVYNVNCLISTNDSRDYFGLADSSKPATAEHFPVSQRTWHTSLGDKNFFYYE